MQSSALVIVLFQFMQNSEQKKICTNFIFWLSVSYWLWMWIMPLCLRLSSIFL